MRRLLIAYSLSLPLAAQESGRDAFAADLAHLKSLLLEKWSYLEHRRDHTGVDIAALEKEALALLGERPRATDFARALRRFVAGIRDGHAGWRVPGVDLQPSRRWPFTLVAVREGIMIDGVHDSAKQVLARGDLVLAIDGRPIEEHIARQERVTSASSDGARRRAALQALPMTANHRVRVRMRRQGQEPEQVVPCVPRKTIVPQRSWRDIRRARRKIADGVHWFRPGPLTWPRESKWRGASPAQREQILSGEYEKLREVFAELKDAKALILDLRGNPGGTDLLGQALASHLIEPGYAYFGLSAQRDGRWREPFQVRPKHGADHPRFSGRLVVLIDESTFSTADNLAACLRDAHPNATFIGQPTGAGTGAPREFTLPNTKAVVSFCTMRVYSPRGTLIEGIGVWPDIAIVPSRDDLLQGRDVALEEAMALLGVSVKK